MQLVQILLPLAKSGERNDGAFFEALKAELTERFGGVTVFRQSPAEGLWADDDRVVRDDIVVFEVMADKLDRSWWRALRQRLEETLRQKEVVIRRYRIERL
jgi:hypothetical protein